MSREQRKEEKLNWIALIRNSGLKLTNKDLDWLDRTEAKVQIGSYLSAEDMSKLKERAEEHALFKIQSR